MLICPSFGLHFVIRRKNLVIRQKTHPETRKKLKTNITVLGLFLLICAAGVAEGKNSMVVTEPVESFAVMIDMVLPGTPEDVFEAITGDVSGWWVITSSEEPITLQVDAFPGGKFLETWYENGTGYQHAVVTKVDYGRRLQFEGLKILAPEALTMTTTWSLNKTEENQTMVTLEIHGICPTGIGVPETVESKWDYLLNGSLRPFLEAGGQQDDIMQNDQTASGDQPSDKTFQFTIKAEIPGSPNEVFDTATGDISGWWDHTFAENPKALTVDPFPGGAFMEIFDDEGNGVRHAVVTAADRGKILRYEGPLGLAGNALFMVTTWTFAEMASNTTLVTIEVHASGEVEDGWAAVIEGVWEHFLNDGLKAYRQAGHE